MSEPLPLPRVVTIPMRTDQRSPPEAVIIAAIRPRFGRLRVLDAVGAPSCTEPVRLFVLNPRKRRL